MTCEQSPSTRFTVPDFCTTDGYRSRRFTCTPRGGTDNPSGDQPSELDAVAEPKQADTGQEKVFPNLSLGKQKLADMKVQ